jgi:membrane protein YdbS with pleckstrin-like domain
MSQPNGTGQHMRRGQSLSAQRRWLAFACVMEVLLIILGVFVVVVTHHHHVILVIAAVLAVVLLAMIPVYRRRGII